MQLFLIIDLIKQQVCSASTKHAKLVNNKLDYVHNNNGGHGKVITAITCHILP
jgi:hypothetical protein